ncbi:uncharacterized protein LOC107039461 [Diachasma alloeum]|uniref:uncharacterized protein LOC107039461 n=1 Tax=Diachasma alloeum TaxID=454923 RepID=UPI00073823A7|nr:uncharacterized protein LOC107039461 [Diachasma alloeum]
MVNSCCVCGVERSVLTADLTFHKLPTNPEMRRKWIEVLKKNDVKISKSLIVCSSHFKPEDYREWALHPLLKKNAVPRQEFLGSAFRKQLTQNYARKTQDCDNGASDLNNTINNEHGNRRFLGAANALASSNVSDDANTLEQENSPHEESEPEYVNIEILTDDFLSTEDIDTSDSVQAEQNNDSFERQRPNISADFGDHIYSLNTNISQAENTEKLNRCCTVPDSGVLRREDFKDEVTWNRFLGLYEDRNTKNALLKQKHERLKNTVETYKDLIEKLMEERLSTNPTTDFLDGRMEQNGYR